MDAEDSPELLEAARRRFTLEEYHRMIDAGVLDEDDHSELLHGILVARSPQSGPHAKIIQRLTGILVRGLGEAYDVRVQLPITLMDDSEPEPDFAIVPHGETGYGSDHPRSALLIIEVSRTSLRFDRKVKAPLYARANVPEVWLIDVNGRQVEVLRRPDPTNGTYGEHVTINPDDALTPVSFPRLHLRGRDLLV